MKLNTKIIILAGPPGCGKGTQAELLTKEYHLTPIQVNRVIREKFKAEPNNPQVKKAQEAYNTGRLINGKVIAQWVTEKIHSLGDKIISQGILIDGAARTIQEAKATLKLSEKIVPKEQIKVFFLKISPQETVKRNTQRIICEKCQKPIDPKLIGKITKCPYCGGKLVKRKMDNEEIIKTRLKAYQKQTIPAINYLKGEGIVTEINGEQPIEKVHQDIKAHLE